MSSSARFSGFPLFDTAELIHEQSDLGLYPDLQRALVAMPPSRRDDFNIAQRFLVKYSDVSGTYNRFRSEIQRFLNYTWHIAKRHLAGPHGFTVHRYMGPWRCSYSQLGGS